MARPPAAARYFNTLAVHASGRRWLPLFAVLHHRGRKSGKDFATPIAVLPSHDAFVIALPWGRDTDWVRNLRAAGGCTITWKGREFDCSAPEFVDKAAALSVARGVARLVLSRVEMPAGFLRLRRSAVG